MIVNISGIGLNVTDSGDGEAVLFLHGLGLSGRMWEPQIETFASRFRCVALDSRGHGMSDRTYGQLSIAGYADDAAGVLDALGIEVAHVVGLSMGGMIAQELGLRHPARLRSLALLDTFDAAGDVGPQLEQAAGAASADGMLAIIAGFEMMMLAPSTIATQPRVVAAVRAMMTSTDPLCFVRATQAIAAHDTTDRLAQLDLPTAVLVGELDRLTPVERARELATAVAGARLEIVPNAGHMSSMENTTAVNAVLTAHLEAASERSTKQR